MMRITKGHAQSREIVCKIGGVGVTLSRREQCVLAIDHDARDHRRKHAQAHRELLHRVEERLLVLLQIFVVRERQTFHGHQHAHEVADLSTGLAAEQLERVGVFLLRHE